jgi:hypothetical protein
MNNSKKAMAPVKIFEYIFKIFLLSLMLVSLVYVVDLNVKTSTNVASKEADILMNKLLYSNMFDNGELGNINLTKINTSLIQDRIYFNNNLVYGLRITIVNGGSNIVNFDNKNNIVKDVIVNKAMYNRFKNNPSNPVEHRLNIVPIKYYDNKVSCDYSVGCFAYMSIDLYYSK